NVAQNRAPAFGDHNWLMPPPVTHLRKRMPEESMIKLREPMHSIFDLRFTIYDWFQGGGELIDFPGGVGRRQGHPQARLAAGDGRMADGRNENVPHAQFGGGFDGFGFVADNQRDNGAARF